ncbi:hypothetical protein BgiBS90_027140 [Biomphalaria glabrata]|nr:hypothetical protein BgiBS90_027140 [Biomphalaria glabrata]
MSKLDSVFMCVLFTCLTFTFTSSITSTFFKLARGYKMTGTTPLSHVTSSPMSSVFCSLLCTYECSSATYSIKYQTCTTFKEKFYNSSITWTKDEEWCMLYRDEPIQYGDWTLVFRAQSGIDVSFYTLWETIGYHDDLPLSSEFPIGCYRMDNMERCSRHFRGSVLDDWTNINQVKVSLFSNGSEVVYMIFNGSSSTRDTWYQQTLILESSWTLLRNDSNVVDFNFQGFLWSGNNRRMVICGQYSGCGGDSTYYMALDSTYDACLDTWSLAIPNFPVFLYSPWNRLVTLSSQPTGKSY